MNSLRSRNRYSLGAPKLNAIRNEDVKGVPKALMAHVCLFLYEHSQEKS